MLDSSISESFSYEDVVVGMVIFSVGDATVCCNNQSIEKLMKYCSFVGDLIDLYYIFQYISFLPFTFKTEALIILLLLFVGMCIVWVMNAHHKLWRHYTKVLWRHGYVILNDVIHCMFQEYNETRRWNESWEIREVDGEDWCFQCVVHCSCNCNDCMPFLWIFQ